MSGTERHRAVMPDGPRAGKIDCREKSQCLGSTAPLAHFASKAGSSNSEQRGKNSKHHQKLQ